MSSSYLRVNQFQAPHAVDATLFWRVISIEGALEWLLPLAKAKNIKFVFLERGHLLRRAVSSAPAHKSTSESKAP